MCLFVSVIRSYTNVLRSDHACCLPHGAKQDGLRNVAFLFRRGSRSLVVRSRIVGAVIEDGWFNLGLCVSLWRSRRGDEGTQRTESAARQSAFLRDHIGFAMFSAGSTLGLRAPDLRQGDSSPWTLFI